ncbi:MAG TPA: carboxypeptidase-like regulatory domain-containing protein, partial [Vicinamibacterales bacterium]|nr:carboxypeptidase-like regulatory domain-containing protein [Vicinamibacterales bacterium]
ASFSDNTTKDVTAGGNWRTGDATVVTVNPGGLLTVVGFGVSDVSFTLFFQSPYGVGNLGTGKTVTATPPGTVAIRGRVSEPGAGPLASTLVVDTLSGRSATTNSSGLFSLAELPRLPYFKVAKDGYEPIEVRVSAPTESFVDLRMQRVIRLIAGETVTPTRLAPADLSYTVGSNRCAPCRLIRVVVPQRGTLHVRVTSALRLRLFAEGQVVTGEPTELIADVAINAPREVVMYLGLAVPTGSDSDKTAFTFETSMR